MSETVHYNFPRFVGNPWQYPVRTQQEFDLFIQNNDGRSPCYTSHNSFPAAPIEEYEEIRYVPTDFDAKDGKLENTLNDALNFRDWARANDLPVLTIFTGGRGFHTYLVFKPIVARVNQALKGIYGAFQITAWEQAKLRTIDKGLITDTRRIMRIVNTKHQKTQLYCVEVPDDMLDRANINEIQEYSKERRPMIDITPKETIGEALKRLQFKPSKVQIEKATTVPTIEYKGVSDGLLKALLPRMCIHQGLMTHNPPHLVRLEACYSLYNLHFDREFIEKFLKDIAEKAQWVDRHNTREMDYQIGYLTRGHRKYKPHSCETVRQEGLCVGEACPIFKKVFPGEVLVNGPTPAS